MNIRDKIDVRYEYNRKLLGVLSSYLETNKDIRFIQALQNLGFVDQDGTDRFYEESYDTYMKGKKQNELFTL